jgi:hypothetical protein
MDVGAAHGVEVGDEYTIYSDPRLSQKSSSLGILVVDRVHLFSSTVVSRPNTSQLELHESAFALLTKHGKRDKEHILEEEQARLSIDPSRNRVVLDILDSTIVRSLTSKGIPSSVEFDTTWSGIDLRDASVHFFSAYCQTNEPHMLRKKVRLMFTRVTQVEGEYDDDLNVISVETGEDLNRNGIIDAVSPETYYGVKIFNDCSIPLYAALFYFDINDLSISKCFIVHAQSKVLTHTRYSPTQPLALRWEAQSLSVTSAWRIYDDRIRIGRWNTTRFHAT